MPVFAPVSVPFGWGANDQVEHDGISARDDLTVCAEAARLAELALHGRGLPVAINEMVFG